MLAVAYLCPALRPNAKHGHRAECPEDVYLQASKSLAKRKREEAEAEAGQREHRRQRLEMRRRGHVVSLDLSNIVFSSTTF